MHNVEQNNTHSYDNHIINDLKSNKSSKEIMIKSFSKINYLEGNKQIMKKSFKQIINNTNKKIDNDD